MTIEQYANIFTKLGEPTAKSLWVSDFKKIATHTRGWKDAEIITKRRPNEPIEVQQYREANHRAITRDPFGRAINNLVRVMSNSEVQIRYPEELREYLSDTYFENKDLKTFFQSHVVRQMIEKANGFLVPWPNNVATDESELNNPLEFDLLIVNPENVKHLTKDVFTFLSKEKSEVSYNGKTEKTGDVYYIIMQDGLYKARQTGKKIEKNFTFETYYTNPTGLIYAMPLGGDVTSERIGSQDVEYFTSFFSSAVPFADECLAQHSDHQGVLVNTSHPIREVDSIPCDANDCKQGKIMDGPSGRWLTCNTCKGTGLKPMVSGPYGILIRPSKQRVGDEQPDRATPVMRFIHADPSILEFGSKTWKDYLEKTERALNLLFIDEAQSGVAKEVDREDKIAMLDKIGMHLYHYLMKNTIQIIYKFRFPNEDWITVDILTPSTFVETTISERIAEIKALKELNAPPVLIAQKMRALASAQVNGDQKEMKKYDVVSVIDPHFMRSFDEKTRMVAIGVLDELSLIKSDVTPHLVMEIERENPDFVNLDNERIIELFNEKWEERRDIFEQQIRTTPPSFNGF